jgi:hypothetical protein
MDIPLVKYLVFFFRKTYSKISGRLWRVWRIAGREEENSN